MKEREGSVFEIKDRHVRFANSGVRDFLDRAVLEDNFLPTAIEAAREFSEVEAALDLYRYAHTVDTRCRQGRYCMGWCYRPTNGGRERQASTVSLRYLRRFTKAVRWVQFGLVRTRMYNYSSDPSIADARESNTARAFEEVCEAIRKQITIGALTAGDKLPPEREMAEQFGVGRNAVREALRSLEMAGVVLLRKGRGGGAFIRPANASRMTTAIQDLLDSGSLGLAELTEARILTVDMIVRLACERATESDFDALARNIDETEEFTQAGLMDQRTERVTEFYRLLAASTRNRVLVLLDTSLTEIIRRFVTMASQAGIQPLQSLISSRRRFLKQLRARNANKASRELRQQLLDLHQSLSNYVHEPEQPKKRPTKRAAKPVPGSVARRRA